MASATRTRVFVVDDSTSLLMFLERSLTAMGHAVTCFRSAVDLLAALSRNDHCDLVLLDLNMPDMDGLEALVEMREKQHNNFAVG
jgi:DNA-binding response OmpR family regulator